MAPACLLFDDAHGGLHQPSLDRLPTLALDLQPCLHHVRRKRDGLGDDGGGGRQDIRCAQAEAALVGSAHAPPGAAQAHRIYGRILVFFLKSIDFCDSERRNDVDLLNLDLVNLGRSC